MLPIAAPGTLALRALMALLSLLLCMAPLQAEDAEERDRLDRLFMALQAAPNAETASEIDRQIWQIWTAPSDPELAERMSEVLVARAAFALDEAELLLDALVSDYPSYAEAWNQRATIHYLQDDLEASLADIEKVLEFEPRHFGALSGRAVIYLVMGKRSLALRDIVTALHYHPFLAERDLFPELLEAVTNA